MEERTDSQNRSIEMWLRAGRSITPLEALENFGCLRLAARISDIKERGLNIATTIVKDGNKRYARYAMIPEGAVCHD